jgi:hypothetical protein
MYGECEMDVKKMILSHIMKKIRVRRDYEIELDLMIDVEQFGLLDEEAGTGDLPVEQSA